MGRLYCITLHSSILTLLLRLQTKYINNNKNDRKNNDVMSIFVSAHFATSERQKSQITQKQLFSTNHMQASSLFEPMMRKQFYSVTLRQPQIDMTQASCNVSMLVSHTHADRVWVMLAL